MSSRSTIRYTYEDYLTIPEDSSGRHEIVYGELFVTPAPDVAVEVVSPSNTVSAMQRKALEYLDAGTRLVWIVDPAERTVTVHRGRDDIRILSGGDSLEGGGALPGFRLALTDLFG